LQAYDFLYLKQKKWCNLQIWGSDQWWNIVAWIDLVRKTTWENVYGITCPLITKADGSKFWKTESWNIWLDETKTSPYKFYQFRVNTPDEDAIKFIKLYTFIPLEEIDELANFSKENPEKRIVQKKLAYELTKMIHWQENVNNVVRASDILFWNTKDNDSFDDELLEIIWQEVKNISAKKEWLSIENIIEQMVEGWISKSKTEVRKLLDANSLQINNCKIKEFNFDNIKNNRLLLKVGKKNYYVIVLE
jgi:tyrosyl-tRNA synthetase